MPFLFSIIPYFCSLVGILRDEDEFRAWTVHQGALGPEAAGVIHSDLQKGFIRAEVIPYQELVSLGGLSEARSKGKLRLEGKNYILQDGDIMHVRFNVS